MAELCSFYWKSIFSKAFCGSQYFSDTTLTILFQFTGLMYNYLVSQKNFFGKKFYSPFIYKELMKNKVKIFKKITNTCHSPKKKPPGSPDKNSFTEAL